MAVLLLLAVGLRVLVIGNSTMPSRDSIVFVRYTLELWDPPAADGQPGSFTSVLRANEHPPGYPLAILAIAKLGGQSPNHTTAAAMGLSAQIASAVAGVLLTIPLYLLARRILGRNAAFLGTAVFSVLPGFVEVTSDGISDGLFWLTAVTALWFGAHTLETTKRWSALRNGFASGICCGFGYLVRPEGAAIALSIGLTLLGLVIVLLLRRRRSAVARPISPRVAAGLALIAGWLVTTLPYMVAIDGISNKPTFRAMFDRLRGREIDRTYFDRSLTRTAPRLPLAVWWDPAEPGTRPKWFWAMRALGSEYLKAGHYVVPVFGLIGLFSLGRRLTDPRVLLLLVVAGMQAVILWLLALGIGYVSSRHTMIIVMVTCIFAGEGFYALAVCTIRAWQRPADRGSNFARRMQAASPWKLAAIWAAIVMAVALPRNFKSLHEDRAGHKAAGLWMKDHVPADWEIVDPFGWAEWYTGRTLRAIPNPDPTKRPGVYAVFEPNAKSPHSRLGYYEMARELHLRPEARMVFQYPTGVPAEQIRVAVYEVPNRVPSK